MKIVQQLFVVVFCFFAVATACAQGDTYDLVIAVSVEPESSDDENIDIYTDKLITEVDPDTNVSNVPAAVVQEALHGRSDAVTESGVPLNASRPYLHMRIWSEDSGS